MKKISFSAIAAALSFIAEAMDTLRCAGVIDGVRYFFCGNGRVYADYSERQSHNIAAICLRSSVCSWGRRYAVEKAVMIPQTPRVLVTMKRVEEITNTRTPLLFVPAGIETLETYGEIISEYRSRLKAFRDHMFLGTRVSYVRVPAGVETIGSECFAHNICLRAVTFEPDSRLKSIAYRAFFKVSLESIRIPSGVRSIGGQCFSRCNKLKDIAFEPGSRLKKIMGGVFEALPLRLLELPEGIQYIGAACFSCCEHLESVTLGTHPFIRWKIVATPLPGNPEVLNEGLFTRISTVKSAYIPQSVERIGQKCFFLCGQLDTVAFFPNSRLKVIDPWAFCVTKIKSIQIPSGVEVIGRQCFFRCDNLEEITFEPDSQLQTIGDAAFSLSKIRAMEIPAGVRSIGEQCFSKCRDLREILFPENSELETISDGAFAYTPLRLLELPDGVQSIGRGCFAGCWLLSRVTLRDRDIIRVRNPDIRGILEKESVLGAGLFAGMPVLRSLSIPSEVRRIGDECFACFFDWREYENTGRRRDQVEIKEHPRVPLEEVTFEPSSELEIIGKNAFRRRCYIHSIQIPFGVRVIDDNCFKGCSSLANVIFESSVMFETGCALQRIGAEAFSASDVRQIIIPAGVTEIGARCFADCFQLENVTFETGCALQEIGAETFFASGVRKIVIPAAVTEIGARCFAKCSQLEKVTFEAGARACTIGKKAFTKSALQSIQIPESVTCIEAGCFSWCKNLHAVIFDPASQLETVGENAFLHCPAGNIFGLQEDAQTLVRQARGKKARRRR